MLIKKNEEVSADIVVVNSSSDIFIDTSQLDGEKVLKQKVILFFSNFSSPLKNFQKYILGLKRGCKTS